MKNNLTHSETLVDSSVWIDYLKNVKSPKTELLDKLIQLDLVAICPQVIQEILQGIRDDKEFNKVRIHLLNLNVFTVDHIELAVGAASMYRALRKKGITVRKQNDCSIAYYCMRFNLVLLHSDRDFNLIVNEFDIVTI